MGEGRKSKPCSASFIYLRCESGSLGDFCLLCLVSLTTSQFEFWPLTWQKWLTEEEGIKLLQPCGEILSKTACMLILPIQLEYLQICHPAPIPPNIPQCSCQFIREYLKEKIPTFLLCPPIAFYDFHTERQRWKTEEKYPQGSPLWNYRISLQRDVKQSL